MKREIHCTEYQEGYECKRKGRTKTEEEKKCPKCEPKDEFGNSRQKGHRTPGRTTAPHDAGEQGGEEGCCERDVRKSSSVDSKTSRRKDQSSAPAKGQHRPKNGTPDAAKVSRNGGDTKTNLSRHNGTLRPDEPRRSHHDRGEGDGRDRRNGSKSGARDHHAKTSGKGNKDKNETIPPPGGLQKALHRALASVSKDANRHGGSGGKSTDANSKSSSSKKNSSLKKSPAEQYNGHPVARPRDSSRSATLPKHVDDNEGVKYSNGNSSGASNEPCLEGGLDTKAGNDTEFNAIDEPEPANEAEFEAGDDQRTDTESEPEYADEPEPGVETNHEDDDKP